MNRFLTSILFSLFVSISLISQTVEGYVYESDNQGYIGGVKVSLLEEGTNDVVKSVLADEDGYFTFQVPSKGKFLIKANKEMYAATTIKLDRSKVLRGKLFAKIELKRVDAYLLELAFVTKRKSDQAQLRPLRRTNLEVYNNTHQQLLIDLPEMNASEVKLNLAQGNHYTILVRKDGYISRRVEAYVDIEGCILCFDGLEGVKAKMVEEINRGDELGVLVAELEMLTSDEGKMVAVENLYYDFASSDLRAESRKVLDDIIVTLEDNAALTIEIGAHTDSRGESAANKALSEQRAQAVVDYLLANSDIQKGRLQARGYGESELLNRCGEGVECSEDEHQENRRTEMKIVGKAEKVIRKSLAEMKRTEMMKGKGAEEEKEALAVKDDLSLLRTLTEIGLKRKPAAPKPAPVPEKVKELRDMLGAVDEATQQAYEMEKIERAKERQRRKEMLAMIDNNKPVEPCIDELGQRLNGYTIVIKGNYGGPIPPSDKIFKNHEIVYRYYEDYKNFLYMVNKYGSKEEADLALQRSFKALYPDAYVVEFKNGHSVRSSFFKKTGGR